MKFRFLAVSLLACAGAFAQSVHNGNFQVLGTFDASSTMWSKPMPTVASDPSGSCSNAAAMLLNNSTGAQKGHISGCIGGTWAVLNSLTSLTLTGDVIGTASNGAVATTVSKINGVTLAGLTGIGKWASGSPGTAAFSDVVSLFGAGACGSGALKGDGTCLGITLPLPVTSGGKGRITPGSTIRRVEASETSSSADATLLCDAGNASITETLEAAPADGREIVIKRVDSAPSHSCTILPGASATIDGNANVPLAQSESLTLQYELANTTWWIL